MRRWLLAGLTAVAAWVAVPAAGAAIGSFTTQVTVTPRSVGPRTAVVVRFVQPVTTGVTGSLSSSDALLLTGPRRSGCIEAGDVPLPAADVGTAMRMTLRPARLGGRWCAGTYRGRLVESEHAGCGIGPVMVICPQFVVLPQTLARFSFQVRAG